MKHGHRKRRKASPTYTSWRCMLRRCSDPNHRMWPYYGGKGVEVAERWKGAGGFANFLADIGPRPTKRHTLGRLDETKGYAPGNVAWQTRRQQDRTRYEGATI